MWNRVDAQLSASDIQLILNQIEQIASNSYAHARGNGSKAVGIIAEVR